MKQRTSLAVALLFATVLLLGNLQAHKEGRPEGPPKGHHDMKMKGEKRGKKKRPGPELLLKIGDQLGLEEKQREKIEGIVSKTREYGKSQHEKVKKEQKKLMELLHGDKYDRKAIEKQYNTVEKLRAELHKKHFMAWLDAMDALKPEQRAKLAQMAKEHHRKGSRPEKGPHHGSDHKEHMD